MCIITITIKNLPTYLECLLPVLCSHHTECTPSTAEYCITSGQHFSRGILETRKFPGESFQDGTGSGNYDKGRTDERTEDLQAGEENPNLKTES